MSVLERVLLGVLLVLGVTLGACLSGCEPAPPHGAGQWSEVRPWPGAPEGTRCWVYTYGPAEYAIGGPECVTPGGER